MAAINFPDNPTLNQIFTQDNKSWQWDGSAWVAASTPGTYVVSVNTESGVVTLDHTDVGAAPLSHTHTAADIDSETTIQGYVLAADGLGGVVWQEDAASTKDDLQNLYIYGKASAAITKGQAIQFAGVQGDHILIKPAVQAEINAEPTYMIGIAETDALVNDFVYVVVNGRFFLDTTAYSAGDILYYDSAGSTPGALTTTEPTGGTAIIQMAAVSIYGVGNGEFIIRTKLISREIHEVIGLQAALDAKVAKAGDTMSGDLNFGTAGTKITDNSITLEYSPTYTSTLALNNSGLDIVATEIVNISSTSGTKTSNIDIGANSGWVDILAADGATNSRLTVYNDKTIITGNVGIGVTNPTFKLAIDGGSQTRGIAYFTQSSPTNSLALDATIPTLHKIYTNDAAANLSLGTGSSTNQLYLKNDGKIGIGTTTPAEKLQVEGNAVINGDLTLNGDFNITGTYTQIDTNVNTTEQWLVTNDGTGPAAIINQIGAQPIIDIQDDGTSAFYIADGGAIGIGTTSPTARLNIDTDADQGIAIFRNTTNANFNAIEFRKSNNSDLNAKIGFNNEELRLDATSQTRFTIADVDAMFINSSRNVGIGTTSPTKVNYGVELTVSGVSKTAQPEAFVVIEGNRTTDANIGSLQFYNNGTPIAAVAAARNGSNNSGRIFFNTVDAGVSTEKMTILPGGNIGIATSSPTEKLSIAGNLNLTNGANRTVRLGSATNYYYDIRSINDDFGIYEAGTTPRLYIKYPSGHVGINTANPSYQLDISSGTNYNHLRVGGAGAPLIKFAQDSYNSGNGAELWQQDGKFYLNINSGLNALVADTSGNIGIGTASPSRKLDVNGAAKIGSGLVNGRSTYGLTVGFTSGTLFAANSDVGDSNRTLSLVNELTTTNTYSTLSFRNSPDSGTSMADFKYVHRGTNSGDLIYTNNNAGTWTDQFSILSNGNVGIGTTSPNQKLEIEGTTRVKRVGQNQFADIYYTGGEFFINASNANNASFRGNIRLTASSSTDTIDTLMIDGTTSNVGIGTTNPSLKLSVVKGTNDGVPALGTASGSFSITKADSGDTGLYGLIFGVDGTGNSWQQVQRIDGTATAYNLLLQPSGGNVGIGTASPTHKLDVSGNLRTTGGINNESSVGGNSHIGLDVGSNTFNNYFTTTTNGNTFFRSFTAPSTYSNHSVITGDGKLGLGTTSPSEKLEVVGDVLISDILHLRGDNAGEYAGIGFNRNVSNGNIYNANSPAFQLQLSSDSLELQRYNGAGAFQGYPIFVNGSTGNVGIGTNDPAAYQLNVNGVIKSNNEILIEKQHSDTIGEGPLLYLSGLNNNSYSVLQQGVGRLGFWQYSSGWFERMSLTGTGNLGIGTTNPKSFLHVAGAGNSAGGNIIMGNTTNNTAKWAYLTGTHYSSDAEPEGVAIIGSLSDGTDNKVVIGGNIYEANPSTRIEFWTHTSNTHTTGGSQRMTINNVGNVGIGTVAPAQKLDVAGNIKGQQIVLSDSSNVEKARIIYDETSQSIKFTYS